MLVSGLSTEYTGKEYFCFFINQITKCIGVDLALKVFLAEKVGEGEGVSRD